MRELGTSDRLPASVGHATGYIRQRCRDAVNALSDPVPATALRRAGVASGNGCRDAGERLSDTVPICAQAGPVRARRISNRIDSVYSHYT